jgi:diguanylate cyclase (GGDEF)-like protein
MELDPLLLSRIQFAFVVSFHAIFPVFTIGLASFIAFLEALSFKTGNPVYEQLSKFWIKVFAVVFGMGVVSGIVMSFQFGTNWSNFAYSTANFIGPVLSYEVVTAFFLEAAFLGVLLFGRDRVPKGVHLFSACMVALGTFISAFWILAANSWLHTPAGVEFRDGVVHVTSWLQAIFNPSFPYRFAHMAVASFLTGSFVVAGVSAWYLLNKREVEAHRKALSMSLWLILFLAPAQAVIGDLHGLNTFKHQPMKVAAMEGNWETERGVAVSPWEAPLRRGHGMILLGTVLGVVLAVHLVVLLFPAKLPRTFLPGIGLTAFKIFYEYGLIALNLLAALAFWRSMKTAQPFNTAALFGAVGAMALSELCFTLYSSVTDQMNLLGHIYKNISYAFLFRAIFVEAVETPKALLQAANRRLQATFEAIPDLLVEVNPDGLLTGYHASRHTDYRVDPKWVVGKQLEDFLPAPVAASCRDTLASASQSGAAQSQPFALTIRGVEYWLQLSIARKPGSGQEGFVAIVRDVSEARHQEAQILQLALYDPLTGLPNRRLFAERIDAALASSERHGNTLALLYLDLDHFKNINDTLGHQAGDLLLQAVAERLRNALREEDVLSRQGGDEFVLYLPAIDAAGAAHVAQRLLDVLSDPVRFGEHDCTPAASIGIAVYPNDGMDFEELSRRADAAMQAKQQGRSTYRFFTPAI